MSCGRSPDDPKAKHGEDEHKAQWMREASDDVPSQTLMRSNDNAN